MKNLIYTQYRPVAGQIRIHHLERTVGLAEAIADTLVKAWNALNTAPPPPAVIIDGRAMTPDAEHFMRFAPR
jgi:hypothetical protein